MLLCKADFPPNPAGFIVRRIQVPAEFLKRERECLHAFPNLPDFRYLEFGSREKQFRRLGGPLAIKMLSVGCALRDETRHPAWLTVQDIFALNHRCDALE